MHHHLEIIMPPTEDVKAAVSRILGPFDESGEDEDGIPNKHAFWDFYVIGGRFSGVKLEAMLGQQDLEEFNAELASRGVTVSGVQFGKPELSPASQIPMVDALWNEFFPKSPIKVCPLFKHFNDQYKDSNGFPDVMRLADVPWPLKASRVIVAGTTHSDGLEAAYMTQGDVWNGVSWIDSRWDGLVHSAVGDWREEVGRYAPEYAARNTPNDDWLAVTVDYHS